MWGNRIGWIIAVVLAALILAPVGWLVQAGRMSPPSGIGREATNLEPIALPISPDDAWPLFSDDGDAAPLYAKAIDAWDSNAADDYVRSPHGAPPASLRLLLDARHMRGMNLFAANPTDLVNYDSDHPRLETLFAAGQAEYQAGLALLQEGNAADGEACLAAAFALGRQLYNERVVFDEYQKGTQLMADSATAMLPGLERGSERWNKLEAFCRKMDEYQSQRIVPVWQVISSVDQDVIAQSAGDVAAFALNSRERMWRVEAALKLGRNRYDAGSPGDQIGAARLLARLADDPDPFVAAAAHCALDLSVENYRMIH
jgi:hypothetical protein